MTNNTRKVNNIKNFHLQSIPKVYPTDITIQTMKLKIDKQLNQEKQIGLFIILPDTINTIIKTMGNQNPSQKPDNNSKNKQNKNSLKDSYEQEYQKTYLQLKNHPDFFNLHLHEVPNFSQNLLKLFPKALESPQDYFEMVTYLRKYQPSIHINKQAQQNAKQSTLLDRFFMICLGNLTFEQFKTSNLSVKEIQNLILDYYMLFIDKPQKSYLQKIAKFIELEEQVKKQLPISAKLFSQKLRQHFPHVQKYLKDYYFSKFHSGKKQFRILSHFKTNILNQNAVLLALRIPEVSKHDILELYNADKFGIGFHAIQSKLVGYTGPWLLLIEHVEKGTQGKQSYIFGTYQNGPIKSVNVFQGDLTGFLFSIDPNIRFMTTDRGDGGQNYFLINSADEKFTKKRKGIGFGGTDEWENFKLWIDQDMDKSKVFNGNDKTYGYGALAGVGTTNLSIKRMEIWGLGTKQNLEDQQKYWQERNAQIMKRRKVDKTQFFDESSGMFFEKTLGHRDQVVGEIQRAKPQEKKE